MTISSKSLFVVFFVLATILFFYLFPGLFFVIFFLSLPVVLLKFTLVKEGTAKVVLKFGGFHKVLLQKKGFCLDGDGNIVPTTSRKNGFFGGLHFVGIRGVHTIHKRGFKWTKALPGGTLEDKKEEGVDFILASVDYQYGLKVVDAEDKDRLPLTLEVVMTARVTNPYKALFSVSNWFDAVASRQVPYFREYISQHSYEEIITRNDVLPAKDVMRTLEDDGILDLLANSYGIEVTALETSKIDPPKEYRQDSLRKWKAGQMREERIISSIDTLMEMLARQTGQEVSILKDEFRTSPKAACEKYQTLLSVAQVFIEQQLAAEAGALKRYYFQGGGGGLDIAALLGDALGKAPKGSEGPKRIEDMSREERDAEYRRVMGG